MGIALFVIALVSNIFTILIVRFGFIGNYEYKQGMILGVHIPQENIGDEEVAGLFTPSAPKRIKPIVPLPALVEEAPVKKVVNFIIWAEAGRNCLGWQ